MAARASITRAIAAAAVLAAAAWVALAALPQWRDPSFWRRQAMPGPLSAGHAFLESDCGTCHTPVRGVEASSCIVCHANDVALLQRQTTAFHADVGACQACHREHAGTGTIRPAMDHPALAAIAARALADRTKEGSPGPLRRWLRQASGELRSWAATDVRDRSDALLDCRRCHSNQDPHLGLFGRECAACHTSGHWTIPGYLHPSPRTTDCVQCHQAPPSHYMEHFRMISMRVAGRMSARVEQCYLCHETTGWNDISGVGYYKHH